MKTKYRIVTDTFAGYEVQQKVWWWPFWVQCGFVNTHRSIERAKEYIRSRETIYYVTDNELYAN